MAAANWVCITLLLSLCLGMCYGNRVGLSAMDEEAKELVNLNQGDKNSDSMRDGDSRTSDPRNIDIIGGGVIFPRDPGCSGGDDSVDIVGGGWDVCRCPCYARGFGYTSGISELTLKIKELTKKLEANGLGQNNLMNMNAMAPESG